MRPGASAAPAEAPSNYHGRSKGIDVSPQGLKRGAFYATRFRVRCSTVCRVLTDSQCALKRPIFGRFKDPIKCDVLQPSRRFNASTAVSGLVRTGLPVAAATAALARAVENCPSMIAPQSTRPLAASASNAS